MVFFTSFIGLLAVVTPWGSPFIPLPKKGSFAWPPHFRLNLPPLGGCPTQLSEPIHRFSLERRFSNRGKGENLFLLGCRTHPVKKVIIGEHPGWCSRSIPPSFGGGPRCYACLWFFLSFFHFYWGFCMGAKQNLLQFHLAFPPPSTFPHCQAFFLNFFGNIRESPRVGPLFSTRLFR